MGATPLLLVLSITFACLGNNVQAEPLVSIPPPLKNSPEATTCQLLKDSGPCHSWVHKWYYDTETEQCDVFIYGGCHGNENRFNSQAECEYHCAAGDHTLPPYMTRRDPTFTHHDEHEDHSEEHTTTVAPGRLSPFHTQGPQVAMSERGEELTLLETGYHKTFTFSRTNTFIQLDKESVANFQLRYSREIKLAFRTRLPRSLLAYHGVKERPEGLPPYALYVLVEKGQLKVKHVIGDNSTVVIVGKGLNRDKWHEVQVRVDVEKMSLLARVDEHEDETTLLGLTDESVYGVTTDLPSVVLIGGLSPEERLHGVKYIISSFIGCIRDVTLKAGPEVTSLQPLKPLVSSRHENIEEGCIDKCRMKDNLCFPGSRCINHCSHYTCDCFGTQYEGEHCDVYTATVLTMRGYSYLSYRIYDWKDRVHASENRISIMFKTNFDNSVLFYADGESHKHHHLAVSILNNSVHIEMDFGSGPITFTLGEFGVTGNHWRNLTLSHHGAKVIARLDKEEKELEIPGNHHHLYLDPEICVGGGPKMQQRKGVTSQNNFVGSLKYAYFNDINVLYELAKGSPRAEYKSVLPPEYQDTEVHILPMTFPFPASHILYPLSSKRDITLKFDFKSSRGMAVLASGNVTTQRGQGFWEIRVVNEEIRFELVPLTNENVTHLTSVRFDPRGAWHCVELKYIAEKLSLTVDYKHTHTEHFDLQFELGDNVMIGSSNRRNTGLVGCLRGIIVDGKKLEPRWLVRSIHAVGQVSLDNCMLIDPCSHPDACKHGGRCSVQNDRVVCDCMGTGYTGKNCHFAEFRRTCEELALLGYSEPDVYLIDIDGNGRFPPAHVKCEFAADETKTIVEHNLPSQVDVRSVQYQDFKFDIKYREFSAEMLQELISHSLYCSQYIKYDCYKAPLNLHSATWFVSSARTEVIDHLGESAPGLCPCGENRTCVTGSKPCHCDAGEAKWHADEAFFTSPKSLGLTELVFLQQPTLESGAQGRITLGSLECVEANTQKYVVTFTSSQSYIEVPGWRTGDIAFSFRTTGERAILLHQPPIRANHPSFTVVLSNDYELTFNFVLSDGSKREMKIQSDRRLNGGDWQKIWIDYNEHHVRFMINTRAQMVDLLPGEQFGPFEGSMFIGGAPRRELRADAEIREGLIGCFRGLVVNGEILNIYNYISVHLSEIIKDCKPSCDPNPCLNNATCKEHWSSFECQCENPWAHLGDLCETDINQQGLTFRDETAFVKSTLLSSEDSASQFTDIEREQLKELRSILEENILLNIRTHQSRSLIFYAHDHLNNFVQLHIENGDTVVFAFNSGPRIEVLKVAHPGLSRGESVQIAIIRGIDSSALHVEDVTTSVVAKFQLLTKYSNKPWENPEQEILAPQRPPVPPTEYFTISLGGLDLEEFKPQAVPLLGFVGCLRGLRVGTQDLITLLPNPSGLDGEMIIEGCHVKCDEKPCHNQGICMEDFMKGESTCNCEFTSYFGPNCAEEKGASFNGDSYLSRKLITQTTKEIKAQLAFSTKENVIKDYKSLLLLIDGDTESFIVSLDSNGILEIEDNIPNGKWSATLTNGFINGARHSVFYYRSGLSANLLVDRKTVELIFSPKDHEITDEIALNEINNTDSDLEDDSGANVYLGGIKLSDKEKFKQYRNYSGCLSNVLVEVEGDVTRPLEEYMGFSRNRTENEKVVGINAAGIKSGFCGVFETPLSQLAAGPLTNMSMLATDRQWKDKAWVEDPPSRIPYLSPFTEAPAAVESNSTVVLIALAMVFVAIVIACIIELIRNHRQYKRRQRQQDEMWVMGSPPKYSDSVLTPPATSVKMVGFKNLANDKAKGMNGTELQPLTRSEYEQVPIPPPVAAPQPRPHSPDNKPDDNEDQKQDKSDAELQWDPIGEGAELLGGSMGDISGALGQSLDDLDEEGGGERQEEGDEGETNGLSPVSNRTNLSLPLSPPPYMAGADLKTEPESPPVRPPRTKSWKRSLASPQTPSPVFLSEHQRTFGNPISYLGGPLARSTQRASKESVLSID